MNHPALEPRDKTLVQILVSNGKASEESLRKACEVLGETRGMGVHLSLAEVLADLGAIDPATFQQASQLAAKNKVFLVDRSSLRHLAVQPDEDAQIARIAAGYDLLRPEELSQATALAGQLAGLGLSVLSAKVLADRQFLDCEVAEGILLLERRRRGAAAPGQAGPAAPPYDDEDLVFGSVAIRSCRLTKMQVERGIKFKIRLRKAGIEKKLPQIFFEQGVLDRAALEPLLLAMRGRLVPPRPVTYELLRFEPEDLSALDRLLQQGTLASPGAIPKALDVQKKLSEMAIERPLVQILVDLGLADRKAIEAAATQRPPPLPVLPSPPSPSAPPPLPGATRPAAAFPAPEGPAGGKRASGVRGGRGTGHGPRPGRDPSGTARAVRGSGSGGVGMLLAGAVAGVAAVAVLGAGIYYFAIREDPGPAQVGPRKSSGGNETGGLSETDFAYELGKIDEAIAEDRTNDAVERGKKLAVRVAGKAEWEGKVASRMERAKELPRFWEALLAAVNGRGKFTCPEGSWKKYEIQSAAAEGLRVVKSGATETTLMRWFTIESASKKSMYQLVVFLGLDASEPFATLHYVVHRHADEAIQRQAAKAISLAPERREEILALVAAAFGVADPGLLVVTADRILTREQKAVLDARGEPAGDGGEEDPGETDPTPGDEDHDGKVLWEGRWVTPEEREELEESAMRAKGLVPHGGRWVTPEEKARLEREEAEEEGLVEYQGRRVTPAEKERLENEAKGLVRHDGRWVTPAEKARLERAENEAKGLVLHEGKWITREEKEALEKKEEMEEKGFVYFRGRWISLAERSMLEDIVEGTPAEEDYHSTPGYSCRIALPQSEKWSYSASSGSPLGGGSAIAAIRKSDGSSTLVSMSVSAFAFPTRYVFRGRGWEEEIKGDNPSGLLRLHRDIYGEKPGASVRTKMEKDFFSKDMHAFWCHLDYPDGSVVKIYSVVSNLRNADKGFVWVVEFEPGQYQVSAIGVDSILKTFEITDKGR